MEAAFNLVESSEKAIEAEEYFIQNSSEDASTELFEFQKKGTILSRLFLGISRGLSLKHWYMVSNNFEPLFHSS